MKAPVLHEPELEFRAGNRHIDPRYGISVYGPADADSPTGPRQIPIALVGPAQAVDGIRSWLQRCQDPIEAKETKPGQENLHQPFPGFSADSPFGAQLVFDDALVREIPERQLRRLARADIASATADAVGLYADAARSLAETGRCRVIICARPEELQDKEDRPSSEEAAGDRQEEQGEREAGGDFHDLLKATAVTLPAPLQLMRKETWTGIPAKANGQTVRPLQDEATRAWNLHTALYYKAGGTPWRMQRHSSDLATCYVGVSFYRSANGNELHTAVAQVFNERGDGVVVRGGTAQISKTDRQPHLTVSDARQLLLDALAEYRTTHGHQPARIVVHKTSKFTTGETDGFHEAANLREIDHVDLLWIQRRGAPHLYRTGQLPPLRGTSVQLGARSLLLYTLGSVPYFRTYPGLYVPQPLLIRPAIHGTDLLTASTDILALTKMNWNNAQLDERDPLTLRTAYRVGSILKHVPPNARIATRYAYYM
ncbi:argonaute/piwi family protein [Streptomyces mirabilis]|uniref:argonaute/piwi family protein n=1 Tax=Streptomyces mirabilis TaxID=68239 RepID=UPI0033B0152D